MEMVGALRPDLPLLLEPVRPQLETVKYYGNRVLPPLTEGNESDAASTLELRSFSTEGPKGAGGCSPGFSQLRDFAKNPKLLPNLIYRQLSLLFRIMKDSQVPWTAKLAASLTVGYVFSPIQLIPSFIPIIGQMDDLAVIWLGMRMVRKYAGKEIVTNHLARLHASSTNNSSAENKA
jgi:uncharacterized membrane protein YkvA (DUF1232 family)